MKQHSIPTRIALLCLAMTWSLVALAQDITSIHGTISDDLGPLMGATVCEIDGNGRVVSSCITDMNGNFTMKVIKQKDKLRIQFVGMTTQTLDIDKTTYNITMTSNNVIEEVVVKSERKMQGSSLSIPEREVAVAHQTISMDEFEGLAVTTVDEALQGRVAGLDIVAVSGNLGAGSVMRLRGASSLSSLTSENPLIVVDGKPLENPDLSTFDFSTANEESFAELLNVNPEDIASLEVLKDASATAMWGSRGGGGVIEIITRRGKVGKPEVSYKLLLSATYQQLRSIHLLNGDDYTMMLKEAYFNPMQNDDASNIPEISYNPEFSEYEQYNNNTDWLDAVTKVGLRQQHSLTISGGGEKTRFYISGGFDNETGTVIGQRLSRFSTRANLDYTVSRRINVQTNFSMTYTRNPRNTEDLMQIALVKMPNMSIYEQDPRTGEDTDHFYNMLQSGRYVGSEVFKDDQRGYVNPVASGYLARNVRTTYDLNPDLLINYDLLGLPGEDRSRLQWRGQVYMRIFNEYVDRYYPSELVTTAWTSGHNTASSSSNKSVQLTTRQTLRYEPWLGDDHKVRAEGSFELYNASTTNQVTNGSGLPSGSITSPNAGGKNTGLGSDYWPTHALRYTFMGQYAYKGRYSIQGTLRVEGTTKFGPDHRWGVFPAVSGRWNVIDEPFMERARDDWKITMLALRAGFGRTGKEPRGDYLYTSRYAKTDTYLDMNAMYPQNLRLNNLKWETINEQNYGYDLGIIGGRLTISGDIYSRTTNDMLMPSYRIPSNSGFWALDYRNTGKLRNTGWEFHIDTHNLIEVNGRRKFTMDVNTAFANNRNEILEMDESVLKNMNSTFDNANRQVLTRVQVHNPFGSIYGFRYKGVYQYEYETLAALSPDEQAAFIASGRTAPVARNAEGGIIYNEKGEPVRMMFAYTNDGTGRNYTFRGGDAIYEDVNHDGNINALDIVYLGSSLPKLTGGFGFTFRYGEWKLNTQFTYRVGNKILNMARLDAEAMVGNNNQSQAVNYRWRKEGDVTSIPRAMYGATSNYNSLVSDRFVEDGSYLRLGYAQITYSMRKKAWMKPLHISTVSTYLSGNNLFVLTHYTGVDPDISSSGYGPATDWMQTPRARYFTFGLTVKF